MTNDLLNLTIREVDPASIGWKRRRDLERDSGNPFEPDDQMWERPDGSLHTHRLEQSPDGSWLPFRIRTTG